MSIGLRVLVAIAASIPVLYYPQPGHTTLMVAGFNFEDNAFADIVVSSSDLGQFVILGGAGSVEEAVTGGDTGTSAFSAIDGSFIELGFSDNLVINGVGFDFAVFELNVPEDMIATIGGVSVTEPQVDTGFDSTINGFDINVSLFDLSDFGLLPGAIVSSIRFEILCIPEASQNLGCTVGAPVAPALVVVGALNSVSVPEPSTIHLVLAGLALLGWVASGRKRPVSQGTR